MAPPTDATTASTTLIATPERGDARQLGTFIRLERAAAWGRTLGILVRSIDYR
jgi:hypothetical protein